MINVLVSGGAGLMGSRVVELFVLRDCKVVSVVRAH